MQVLNSQIKATNEPNVADVNQLIRSSGLRYIYSYCNQSDTQSIHGSVSNVFFNINSTDCMIVFSQVYLTPLPEAVHINNRTTHLIFLSH